MNVSCGCCDGIQVVTPETIWNPPGLDAVSYRVGTYSTFFGTMLARISNLPLSIPALNGTDPPTVVWPLSKLTTRDPGDPAIALLDAWAVVADVLTFYQERIANEGFLRTALERRSVLELGRLIGYRLRPGVSASVYLAFTLQDGNVVDIPAGTQSQSVPGPGELPQYFETSDVLAARDVWNSLQPRITRPQLITWDGDTVYDAKNIDSIYFDGTSTNLNPNDALLLVSDDSTNIPVLRRVQSVDPDSTNQRTKVTLQLTQLLSDSEQLLKKNGQTIAASLSALIQTGTDIFSGVGMAETIVAALTSLQNTLNTAILENDPESFVDALQQNVEFLREQQAIAADRNYTRLAPWIQDLLTELEKDLDDFSDALAALRAGAHTPASTPPKPGVEDESLSLPLSRLGQVLGSISLPPSLQPANSIRLARALPQSFASTKHAASDGTARILRLLRASAAPQFYRAWASVTSEPPAFHVFALRSTNGLFGDNVPPQPSFDATGKVTAFTQPTISNTWAGSSLVQQIPAGTAPLSVIALDAQASKILPGGWAVISRPDLSAGNPPVVTFHQIQSVQDTSMSAFSVSVKTTQLTVSPAWLSDLAAADVTTFVNQLSDLLGTRVLAQSEELKLAEAPIEEDIAGSEIELAQLYDGLDTGRWVIVSGTRTDVPGATGIAASELVMLSAVNQGFGSVYEVGKPTTPPNSPVAVVPPGEKVHTTIILANDLAYTYDRATLKIYANVTKATHGKSQAEALGSGDGSKTLQTFPLHQPPLTYLPAVTPSGASSTLQIRVNDLLWHEVDNLTLMAPGDHSYITHADDNEVTSATFGTGTRGARLPTGPENVKASYRNGIGSAGNAAAKQISQLVTRPLGVTDVINPLPATGGADRDTVNQARDNAPLAVMALDRIVSVQDYADFARSFAGIGKASSARFQGLDSSFVHVTIAGVNDVPIATTSDLYAALLQSMQTYGDPFEQIQLDLRSLVILIISARVRVSADYLWDNVEPNVRAALNDAFGFANRALGQSAFLSEVISTIQKVKGVEYVEVDGFGGISDTNPDGTPVDPATLLASIHSQLVQPNGTPVPPKNFIRAQLDFMDKTGAHPAQLAYLSPSYPDSLILKEITQ